MHSTYLLFGLVVVIVILVLYFSWRDRDAFADEPKVTTHAAATAAAVDRGLRQADPTPADRLRTAAAITRGVLAGGDARRPRVTGADRMALRQRAREQIAAAIEEVARAPMATLNFGLLDRFGFEAHENAHLLDPFIGMLLDTADEHAFEEGLFGGAVVWGVADPDLAARSGTLRADRLETRRQAADQVAAAAGKGAGVETYVALATQNTSDGQNVHDPGVLACLRAIIERLRLEQKAPPSLDQVIRDLQAEGLASYSKLRADTGPRPEVVADAVAVAEKTREGETAHAMNATDLECLTRVWARTDDPRNAAKRQAMRQAVFDALVDAWEPDYVGNGRHIACVNGRTGRILGSLATLDYDKRNWMVKRLEQFKNDVYDRAGRVIESEAALTAESGTPAEQSAAKLYLAKTADEMRAVGPVDPAASQAFTERLRGAIGRMVDEYVAELDTDYGVRDAIPKYMIDSVKAEAQMAA